MNDTSSAHLAENTAFGSPGNQENAPISSQSVQSESDKTAERLGRMLKDLGDAVNDRDFAAVRALKIYVSRYFTADLRDLGVPIIRGWDDYVAFSEKMATRSPRILIEAKEISVDVDYVEGKAEFRVFSVQTAEDTNLKFGAQNLFTWRREWGRWLLRHHTKIRNLDMAI